MKKTLSSEISVTRDERVDSSPSSKGNQIKWRTHNGLWIKADDLGYEGLAEAVASKLLEKSNLTSFVPYAPCIITEESVTYRGCVSDDFLAPGESLITIHRLYETHTRDVYAELDGKSASQKLADLIESVTGMTGIREFASWFGRLLEFDAFILNEDRHLHNIAVIRKADESFRLMPIFDNGAAFLSDSKRDYPLSAQTIRLIDKVRSKPIATNFDKQMAAVREVVGLSLELTGATEFNLAAFNHYSDEELGRVNKIIKIQSNRYPHLFT